jgi:hypothetical protein
MGVDAGKLFLSADTFNSRRLRPQFIFKNYRSVIGLWRGTSTFMTLQAMR